MSDEEKEIAMMKWKARDLSWSQISSFEYDPEQWYRNYFLGVRDKPSAEMLFGSKIGKLLEKDPDYLPMIPRESVMEYKFQATHMRAIDTGRKDRKGNPIYDHEPIQLVGYADSFCDDSLRLREYKTGVKAWDKKRVEDHGQITMYLYMKHLNEGIHPDTIEASLHWMPTVKKENGDFTVTIDFVPNIEKEIKHFPTKRTMVQLIEFGERIDRTLDAMDAYIASHE